MTTQLKSLPLFLMVFTAVFLTSCFVDDPGPIQQIERQYTVVDFDRLEMGDAFHIQVEQGNFFDISISGDRRNIEDLIVKKEGSTLVIRYRQNRERRHDTFIRITMPELSAVNFSAASDSRVSGFADVEAFDLYLSGASVCQLDVDAFYLNAVLSGASYLSLRGAGVELDGDLSGASALKAFSYPVSHAHLVLSGASDGKLTVSDKLEVEATGASHVVYRGQPAVVSEVSGSSSVHQE
jgi:hypothetical protein